MRKIFFVVLIAVILTSCGGAQPATREDDAEVAAVPEEGLAAEDTTEPTAETTAAGREVQPTRNTPASPAAGSSGMVSTANPLATRAGLDVLEEGGNAFDASVAVAAALNVVEPYMSGIGGYGSIVIYDAERGEVRFLDAGSRMPANLDPDAFRPPTPNYSENRRNAKSVSTPSSVDAWETLSEDYGDLEWRRLFDPAIELAEGGFVIGDVTAGWISSEYSSFPEHAKSIYGNNGAPLRSGETLVQEDLARSLGLVAGQGTEAVYGGELGLAIDATMRESGGFLTIDDFANNRAGWRDTISIDHRGYEVVSGSPPTTAWNTLSRLGVMGQFDLEALDHNSVPYLHTFAEVTKQAYSERQRYAADPEIQETPLDLLLSEEYWAGEAARVNLSRATPYAPSTTFNTPAGSAGQASVSPDRQEHTTHFVVADEEGNVVSATYTIGNVFGSRIMPEGTGIWLNDSISYSDFEPEGNPLDAFPGRQRLMGVSPILVMSNGRPVVALGTPGGRTIPQTTPQMLINLIDFNMDIQQAIAAPRISFVEPDLISVDTGIPQPVRDGLSAFGHNVVSASTPLGNAHGLTVEYDDEGRPSRFAGGSDPRGEGAAVGY